jgi:hypothetical protein
MGSAATAPRSTRLSGRNPSFADPTTNGPARDQTIGGVERPCQPRPTGSPHRIERPLTLRRRLLKVLLLLAVRISFRLGFDLIRAPRSRRGRGSHNPLEQARQASRTNLATLKPVAKLTIAVGGKNRWW